MRKRVLFLSDIALKNPTRGTPIHTARLLEELHKEHDLVVCAKSVPDSLQDIFVPYPTEKGMGKLRAMLRIVREHKIETVFTIGQVSLLAPVVLKFMRGVRIVVELQGIEYIEKYAMGHIGLLHYYVWKFKSMALLPLFDTVIAFSWQAARLYPFLRHVSIIFPAIDIDAVPIADASPIPPLIVGYAGNTDAYQGLTHIIEASGDVKKRGVDVRLRLVLSGNDERIEAVRALLQKHDVADVTTMLRNLTQAEVLKEMQTVSVLPIPRTSALEAVYGFPSKLPECFALGIPVVVSDVGAVSELMPEIGQHSFVISTHTVTKDLADVFLRIAKMSPEERMERGRGARTYAGRFSWKDATQIASRAL